MEFVQNFTPPDFQAKNFTPSISPNFNSFSKKKHKKWVKMEKFTPLARNFTLPPGRTNFTSEWSSRNAIMLWWLSFQEINGFFVPRLIEKTELAILICLQTNERSVRKEQLLFAIIWTRWLFLNQTLSSWRPCYIHSILLPLTNWRLATSVLWSP